MKNNVENQQLTKNVSQKMGSCVGGQRKRKLKITGI